MELGRIKISLEFELDTKNGSTASIYHNFTAIDSFCLQITPGYGCTLIPVKRTDHQNIAKTEMNLLRRTNLLAEMFVSIRGSPTLSPVAIKSVNGKLIPEMSRPPYRNGFSFRVDDGKIVFIPYSHRQTPKTFTGIN